MLRRPAPTSTPRAGRRRRLPLALGVAAVVGLGAGTFASAASAAQTTTTWYSLDQKPATTSSPAQFLTATSTGQVVLKGYQSGEWRQQWAPVYPEWPASPTITASSPFSDFFGALKDCIVNLGCPFTGGSPYGSPRKYVNRMYAMCLTFQPTGSITTRVVVSRCGGTSVASKRQLFQVAFADKTVAKSGIPRTYTDVFGTRADDQGRCLDSAGGSSQPGTNAAALICGPGSPVGTSAWSQQFRFLQSGSATCKQNYPGTLCGLGAPVQ
ncbi:MAG: hypothetical protein PGN13_10915 [Patulibacter minatonensis]